MRALDHEQEVIDLATRLGLKGRPVGAIINYCQQQIDSWVDEVGGVTSISDLEALVAARLNLVFENVREDADLDDLKKRYVQRGEIVFAHIVQNDLTPDTFGTMVRLKDGSHVAVIDCRGEKAARLFFTRWHEISHLLVEPACERQVFRKTDQPLERLMDQIAGHVGFYHLIFDPILEHHLTNRNLLTFEFVESVRQSFCPYASFQSTLIACLRRVSIPVLYLEARMAYSESQRRGLNQMRMFDEEIPEQKLRVQLAIPNDAATDMNLTARWNMRVPETSPIFAAFTTDQEEVTGVENLNTWTFSKGGHLMSCEVFVQARRVDQFVMATIQPLNER